MFLAGCVKNSMTCRSFFGSVSRRSRPAVMLAAASLAVSVLYGDGTTYNPLELDADGEIGYTIKCSWNGESEVSPDKDYRVSGGKILQINAEAVGVFKGRSLAIGVVGGTSGILGHNSAGTLTVTNLIMANGYYRTWSGSSSKRKSVSGTATVISPESAPFRIYPCHDAGKTAYTVDWEMVFAGAVGTRIQVGDKGLGSASTLNIGSSSPGYLGTVEVSGTNLVLGIAAGDSLGGPLDVFDPDALALKHKPILRAIADDVFLDASYNRGIEIDGAGAAFDVPESGTMTLGWPVAGDGAVTKTGKGTLVISNEVSVGIVLTEGTLAMAPGTATVELPHFTLAGGGMAFATNSGLIRAESVTRTGEYKIPVSVIGDADVGAEIPFLDVPAGTLAEDDFTVLAGSGEYGAPYAEVVKTTDNGRDVFSLKSLPLVTVEDGTGWRVFGTTAAHWSDGKALHDGAAYLVRDSTSDARHVYLVGESYNETVESDYVFPGHSLTLSPDNGNGLLFRLIAKKLTIDMRAFGKTSVYQAGLGSGEGVIYSRNVCGKLAVNTSTFNWHVGPENVVTDIGSEISGDETALIKFDSPADLKSGGAIVLSGNNDKYKGAIHFEPYNAGVVNSSGTLRISDEINLGGNPPVFIEKCLYLTQNTKFHPIGSVEINDTNRGVYLCGSGIEICVDSGETLTFSQPEMNMWKAKVAKTGGGTFCCAMLTRNSGGNTLSLDDGYIRAVVPDAFRYFAPLTFNGGGLELDHVTDSADSRSQYGMALTNKTLGFASSAIPVKIECGEERPSSDVTVPLFIVRKEYADDMADRLSFERKWTVGQWCFSRRDVTVRGTECTLFTANYRVGLCISVR